MGYKSAILDKIQGYCSLSSSNFTLRFIVKSLFIILVVVNLVGCCSYSFTGSSVPAHLKSISIPVVDDRSGSGEPGLRENFTTALTQKFIDDNSLRISDRVNANASLECTIASYGDAPEVVSAGLNIQTRRITIGVQVIYRDLVQRKTIFEQTFSNYAPYANDGTLAEKTAAINKVIDLITQDILLAVVSGW
jgi:hypothetical protein